MDYEDFCEKVKRSVEECMGDGYIVKINDVIKLNETKLKGISIFAEGGNISPTIYLEDYYRSYEDGDETFGDIINRLIGFYRDRSPRNELNMNFFNEYKNVRKRLSFRLISEEKNKLLLEDTPYIPYLDLAICFYYSFKDDDIGNGSILIKQSHIDKWGVGTKELMEDSMKNSRGLFPPEFGKVTDVILSMKGFDPEDYRDEYEPPLYILTNTERLFGAAAILYPDMLKEISGKLDSDIYVIPSSVHEVLILPEKEVSDPDNLRTIIREINRTQVRRSEVLSDTLYFYEKKKGKLEIAA
ncbi:MAG: DUF5688 family protein [Lachnospiraceae bacterium]|nr:DUF5688 family protein [Lachnospiraceae bacterium]